jgi:hypothetical protein
MNNITMSKKSEGPGVLESIYGTLLNKLPARSEPWDSELARAVGEAKGSLSANQSMWSRPPVGKVSIDGILRDPSLATDVALDNKLYRASQAKGMDLLTKALAVSLIGGAGWGLLKNMDKIRKTKKIKEDADILKSSKFIDPKPGLSYPSKPGAISEAAAELASRVKQFFGRKHIFDAKGNLSPMSAPLFGIPGSMLPIGMGVVGGGVYAGDKLMDWVTDRYRSKALDKKKKEMEQEFMGLLSGKSEGDATKVAHALADAYEKKATDIGPYLTGLAALTALGIPALSFGTAYSLSKKQHPNAAKLKALEDVMENRKRMRPVKLKLKYTDPEEEQKILSTSGSRPEYRASLPLAKPSEDRIVAPGSESEEVFNLDKVSHLYKQSEGFTEWAGEKLAPIGTGLRNIFKPAVNNFIPEAKQVRDTLPQIEAFKNELAKAREEAQAYRNETIPGLEKRIAELSSKYEKPIGELSSAVSGLNQRFEQNQPNIDKLVGYGDKIQNAASTAKGYASSLFGGMGDAAKQFMGLLPAVAGLFSQQQAQQPQAQAPVTPAAPPPVIRQPAATPQARPPMEVSQRQPMQPTPTGPDPYMASARNATSAVKPINMPKVPGAYT